MYELIHEVSNNLFCRCDENSILLQLVNHFIEGHIEAPTKIKRLLKCYKTAGIDSIDVLMKAEKIANSDSKYEMNDAITRSLARY